MFHATRRLIVLLALSAALAVAHGAGFYRWVDENGNIHYRDIVPPSQTPRGYIELTDEGVRINTIPPAKTLEEFRAEEELERLRAEKERLLEEQRAADSVLLRTFRSEDDLIMARDGKIEAIDMMVQVTRGNIRRQQDSFSRLRASAADYERAGKQVPQQLHENLVQTERAIREAYTAIVERERKKESIREDFGRDLERFRQLKNLPQKQPDQPDEKGRPLLSNTVTCSGPEECDRLWAKATAYVTENAANLIPTTDPNVLVTAPPYDAKEIGLILSRISIRGRDDTVLFLDLQCKHSVTGRKTCSSDEAQRIIKGFKPAVGDASEAVP